MLFFALHVALAQTSSTSTSGTSYSPQATFSGVERLDAPSDAVLLYHGYNVSAVLRYDGQEVALTTAHFPMERVAAAYVQPPAGGWPVGTDLVVDLNYAPTGDLLDSLSFQSDGHLAVDGPALEVEVITSDWAGDSHPFRNVDLIPTTPNGRQPWDQLLFKRDRSWSVSEYDVTRHLMQRTEDGEAYPLCYAYHVLSEAGVLSDEIVVCPAGDPPEVTGPIEGEGGGTGHMGQSGGTGDFVLPADIDDTGMGASASSGCSTVGSLGSFGGLLSLVFAFRRRQ